MAANVVVIRDEQKWEIIRELLADLCQGGIIIPPEQAERLDENFPGWEDHLDTYIEYDFGGEPEVTIDVAYEGSYAQRTIDSQLIDAQQELRE